MSLAGKVATGVAVLVVASLVALAAPAVAAVHGELSSWAVFEPTEEPSVELAPEDDPIGKKMIDELGDGYVYVGNGTAIPKDSPAGCENPAWLHLGEVSASLSGDAPAGYQQIPYQLAIEAMSNAAQARDLDAMRAIFANDLSGLFPDPADADEIADALDAGDLDVLCQMFA